MSYNYYDLLPKENLFNDIFEGEKTKIRITLDGSQKEFKYFSEVIYSYPNYNKITEIYCMGEIYEIPMLPKCLQYLSIEKTKITKLPKLPRNLETLSCQCSNLTTLPKLPSKLKGLYCNNNKLTELPELPSTLKTLKCDNNKLTKLPDLPLSLRNLDCYANKITKLPNLLHFNKNMTNNCIFYGNKLEIDCSYNNITELPYYNPKIIFIDYFDNPIDKIINTYFTKSKEEW